MKGLVQHDLLQIGSGVKGTFLLVYLVFMAMLSLFGNIGTTFASMMVFISTMFGIAAFSYDEAYHWDCYAAALPVTNRQIVLARYCTQFVMIFVGIAAGMLLGLLSYFGGHADMTLVELLSMMAGVTLAVLLFTAIMVPLLYRFGAERGRIVMLILFFAMFAAFMAVFSLDEQSVYQLLNRMPWKTVAVSMVAVVLVALVASVECSVRIREKKDF